MVSKNATQFKGNAQHDAQEFLLWLLDRVHEDLNTVNPNSRPAIKVNPEDIWCSCSLTPDRPEVVMMNISG